MMRLSRFGPLVAMMVASAVLLHGQGVPPFQDDFPAEEFVTRRNSVLDAIGPQAIALIQGAPGGTASRSSGSPTSSTI